MEPAPLKARPAPAVAAPERKPSPSPQAQTKPEAPATPRLPAYAQARLAISHPQDAAEQQADRIAAQVSRPASAEEPTEPVPTPTPRPPPPAPADASDPTEQRIASRRGTGQPLPEAVRADMASRFGDGFTAVRVHTDAAAAELCRDVQAHAFTVGADIFFAAGAFAPETRQGKELLAHELTHVVQQRGMQPTTLARTIIPESGVAPTPVPNATSQSRLNAVTVLPLPRSKRRHLFLFQSWLQANRLQRKAGYDREDPRQVSVWNRHIAITPAAFNAKLRDQFEAFFARGNTFGLGVCNGCQMFAELADIIPGAAAWPRFTHNQSGRFEARLSQVEILESPSLFLNPQTNFILYK